MPKLIEYMDVSNIIIKLYRIFQLKNKSPLFEIPGIWFGNSISQLEEICRNMIISMGLGRHSLTISIFTYVLSIGLDDLSLLLKYKYKKKKLNDIGLFIIECHK
jgi:hypothetical protein